jgi:predicted transcriptional regulator
MPILANYEAAALRFMKEKPLRVDPFARVENVERVAAMLDRLSKMGLCRRTLEGLNRVYSITPDGLNALLRATERGEILYSGPEGLSIPEDVTNPQSAAE